MTRLVLALMASIPAAGPVLAEDVLVFAAASLALPLDRMAEDLPGVAVSYGGSGALARQVLQGAPADVVVLAHPEWIAVLEDGDVLTPGSIRTVAGNTLVLAGPAGAPAVELADLPTILGDGRIATGFVDAVPAGQYAKAALIHLGLWDTLSDRLAETDNVRAALALVARGEAPFGIVYGSDVHGTDAVALLATFPPESHPPIRYEAALTVAARPGAAQVLDWLTGPDGQAAFAAAGFLPARGP